MLTLRRPRGGRLQVTQPTLPLRLLSGRSKGADSLKITDLQQDNIARFFRFTIAPLTSTTVAVLTVPGPFQYAQLRRLLEPATPTAAQRATQATSIIDEMSTGDRQEDGTGKYRKAPSNRFDL